LWDEEYPPHLRAIYDPPPLLFVRGTIEPSDASSVALVGTRAPSAYGLQAAQRFAAGLARLGVAVVSGLARGIDTAAHAAALGAGGRTLAVIGSGIDVPYPPENRGLAARIAACGAVVSEYPMGTKPDAGNFPRRNRIISGITLGTVVVETAVDGGAMITARTALDQNREVFAYPAAVREGTAAGTNRLIREGKALLVESVDDVLAEFGSRLGGPAVRSRPAAPEAARPALTLFEQGVLDAVPGDEPAHINALAGVLQMPVAELLAHLLALECKGLVRQLAGKYFLRG
ncbi:MAG TPA: DNA-processing protein DprA, partial [Bacteroidota bacterium]